MTSRSAAQNCSVGSGVRKLEVQLTVVEPPTERPCRIVIAPSDVALARPAALVQVAVGARLLHVAEVGRGLQRPFLDEQHLQPGLAQDLGRHAAAGAAADDGDVGLQRLRRFQRWRRR